MSAHTNLEWVALYQKQPGCSVDIQVLKATLSFSYLKGKDWVLGSDLLTGNETDAIKCGFQDEEQPVQPQSPYLPHCMIPWSTCISGGLVLISLPNRSMSLNL